MKRFISIAATILVIVLIGYIYYAYFFVFGEGVKAGELNYIVKKGYIFKTNEGRLIQSGIRSQAQGTIQSNEFMFSVTDEAVMEKLSRSTGKHLELHYKEYIHPLPWRGVSVYVVDSIISVRETEDKLSY